MRTGGPRLLLAACLFAAGCSTAAPQDSADSDTSAPAATAGQPSETGASDAAPSDAVPTSASAQASTVDGPCPYLEQDFIELTIGQRIGKVSVTTTTPAYGPLPRCDFQRGSGEPAAVVDTRTIEAGQGLEKALEAVPGGNPVDVGEGGSVQVYNGEDRTELAAYEGTTLVTVRLNQESSLEAIEIAGQVFASI
ncbi:DUF2020 domain-containing protein [Blastococcus sp. Marseille-P5729]|uniref:DUF2020 domain-containing protein n=1 Tax=Blastococcus sp. Marseille-P5729 TaxID=2086582 RepID=UPI00131C6C69|nr:DUF2020 domain-containing protein [Blastococcus sp. Marseille-P5729]